MPNSRPHVVLTCGPPGSGKSTYATSLEARGYARVSIDTAAWAAGHRSQPLPAGVAEEIEAQVKQQLVALVRERRDVVVDLSFYSREFRDTYRDLLAAEGVRPELVYFAIPREMGLERVRRRVKKEGEFELPMDLMERHWDGFEIPGSDEEMTVMVMVRV